MKHMWSEEEIQSFKKDISNLVDSKGNPRFVEGNGTPATIEGFTSTYCKWSLSGTHLMLVLAGNVENETTLSGFIVTFALPEYIMNKIYPIFSSEINRLNITLWGDDFSSQASYIQLLKDANGKYLYFNIIIESNCFLMHYVL